MLTEKKHKLEIKLEKNQILFVFSVGRDSGPWGVMGHLWLGPQGMNGTAKDSHVAWWTRKQEHTASHQPVLAP